MKTDAKAKCHRDDKGNLIACAHLFGRLGDYTNGDRKKGLRQLIVADKKDFVTRVFGYSYHTSQHDRGIMLSFCPWCGENILDSEIRKTKTAKEPEER